MWKVLGRDEWGKITIALLQSALQQGTYDKYGSILRSFFKFCEVFYIDPLSATSVDIARYLAWLGKRGTIAATSLQFYLSAINRYLQDHARPPIALGPLVSGVRKGIENNQEDTDPHPKRVPLPAPVAGAILELAEQLLRSIRVQSDHRVPLLLASVATITSYMFFSGGECSACAHAADLVVSYNHITLLLRNEE